MLSKGCKGFSKDWNELSQGVEGVVGLTYTVNFSCIKRIACDSCKQKLVLHAPFLASCNGVALCHGYIALGTWHAEHGTLEQKTRNTGIENPEHGTPEQKTGNAFFNSFSPFIDMFIS